MGHNPHKRELAIVLAIKLANRTLFSSTYAASHPFERRKARSPAKTKYCTEWNTSASPQIQRVLYKWTIDLTIYHWVLPWSLIHVPYHLIHVHPFAWYHLLLLGYAMIIMMALRNVGNKPSLSCSNHGTQWFPRSKGYVATLQRSLDKCVQSRVGHRWRKHWCFGWRKYQNYTV